jgi:hypothetical protein
VISSLVSFKVENVSKTEVSIAIGIVREKTEGIRNKQSFTAIIKSVL